MSDETKDKWTEKFFTPEELKEFEKAGRATTPAQMEAYQKKWADLLAEVEQNLQADPAGPKAQELAGRWAALMEEGWGEHPGLQQRVGQAYGAGAVPQGFGPSAQAWAFMKKAMEARTKK